MHVLFLNYSYDQNLNTPDDLLRRYHILRDSAETVRKSGASRVTVLQRFKESARIDRDGVHYIFVNDNLGPVLSWWDNPRAIHEEASRLDADVIQINGIAFFAKLLRTAVGLQPALLWQNRSPRHPRWRAKWLWRKAFKYIDGVLFTSSQQAKVWIEKGYIVSGNPVYEIVGGSANFSPISYDETRSKLGMSGQTAFLWVGRLDVNKDPLTVLSGFREVCDAIDSPHLYMVFGTEELLEDVKDLTKKLSLDNNVHLLGRIPHEEMPAYFSAADFFVLGSHREECGFAAIEAMACGALPILTDIPAFRSLTNEGRIGFLWQAGSARSFAGAALDAKDSHLPRTEILRYFPDSLSYEALGKRAIDIYSHAIDRARSRSVTA